MTFLSIIISALLAFGLGDIVDVLESDEVESALNVAESFQRANSKITEVEEYFIGRSVAATVLNMYTPLEDPAMQQYVNLIGQTVACSSPKPTLFDLCRQPDPLRFQAVLRALGYGRGEPGPPTTNYQLLSGWAGESAICNLQFVTGGWWNVQHLTSSLASSIDCR